MSRKPMPRAEFMKDFKIVRMIFLKLESRKLRACLEIRLKGLEENFYYFKYTNVTMFVIMPLTADPAMMIFIFKVIKASQELLVVCLSFLLFGSTNRCGCSGQGSKFIRILLKHFTWSQFSLGQQKTET